MRKLSTLLLSLSLFTVSCRTAPPPPAPPPAAPPVAAPSEPVHIVVVGTTDLHGWFAGRDDPAAALPKPGYGGLAVFAGYLANLRAANPGRVVVVDSGDLFQGTLESNLFEGEAVVEAYNEIGYSAAAIGNHEFDFGPVGPDPVVREPGQDPLGALKKNAANARFPLLSANLTEKATGMTPAWAKPYTLLDVGGIRVGIIGLSTPDTPNVTTAANVATLSFGRPVPATIRAAAELRARGADAVIVIAHMGGRCTDLKDVHDVASCDPKQEAFEFLSALPPGTIDAYFAGHTHQQMREIINGVPALQPLPFGQAFSTIDLYVDRASHRVVDSRTEIRPPTNICENVYTGTERCDPKAAPAGIATLAPRIFEGAPVVRDRRLDALFAPYLDKVAAKRREPVGVRTAAPFKREYSRESALGDLYTDALRAAVPASDIAFMNSGSLRVDLPAKELTYGDIFEISPFDNLIVVARLTGAQIRQMLRITSEGDRGILQMSGLRMTFDAAKDAALTPSQRDRVVSVAMSDGSPLQPDKLYTVVITDFLLTGGEGLGAVMKEVPSDRVTVLSDRGTMREVFIDGLRKMATGGVVTPATGGRITVLNDDKRRD
jgi:5'-nucleotidase